MSHELTIAKPSMQTAAQYRSFLTAIEREDRLDAPEVNGKSQLIPFADCHKVIAELSAALEGCDDKAALVCAKKLIGCYRIKDVVDPDIYIQTVAEKFRKLPPDVALATVNEITDTQVFPPSPAEVVQTGRGILRKREIALYVARKHLEEHERRRAWKEQQDRKAADKEDGIVLLREEYEKAGLEWPGDDNASWVAVAKAGMGDEK